MRDRDMAAAIAAGDPAGLSAAFDRYAAGLFTYCQSLLAEPADAADVVQDTFVIAAQRLGALRDPDRLRPWLYAVARNECRRRLRAAADAPLDEAAAVTGAPADLGASLEQAELRELVWAALPGLSPGEREIIELSLRHELAGADLADTLGVPRNQAHAMVSRARAHFRAALGVLLVARSGPGGCAELAAILRGWDGRLTVLLRKRASRHIRRCPACGARQRREMSPETLLGLIPVAVLPATLRPQVLSLLADPSPAAAARRLAIGHRAGPPGPGGFPRAAAPPGRARLLRRPGPAGAAAAGGAAVVSGALVTVVLLPHHPAAPAAPPVPSAAVPAGGSGGPARPALRGGPARTAPPAIPGAGAGPGQQAGPRAGPAPTALPTAAGATGPAAPVPARVSLAGRLVITPASLTLRLSLGGPATGAITLTAAGGPVGYHLTVPAAYLPGLRLSRTAGTLAAGHRVRITVSAAAGLLPGAVIQAAPGRLTVPVSIRIGGG